MNIEQSFVDYLRGRQAFKSAEWMEQLDPRKREEIEFHNFEREKDDPAVKRNQIKLNVHANKKYYTISSASQDYVNHWLGLHVPGKVFLDYACGNGGLTIKAGKLGAQVSIGLDISDVSIKNARASAQAEGLADRCFFIQGDCEATELPDSSVDVVLCTGMLHHLDLNRAYPELFRILKPGGRLLAVEAFGHNPAIQLYRNLTPHLRTDWEKRHILKRRDIRHAQRFGFAYGEIRYWHLFALGAVPFRNTVLFPALRRTMDLFDRIALSLPGIRLMAWQVTFELIRP
jgi:SAM-dependent methyltransferase